MDVVVVCVLLGKGKTEWYIYWLVLVILALSCSLFWSLVFSFGLERGYIKIDGDDWDGIK